MSMPTVIIDGKKITMPKPKIKLWRSLIKFTEQQSTGELDGEGIFDAMIDLMVVAFNNPVVTAGAIEENVDLDEMAEIFSCIAEQVQATAAIKAAQVPNVVAPARARKK